MRQMTKLLTFLALWCFAFAVGQTIQGKVTDAQGNALALIDVIEKGTTNGVNTDSNGEFRITLKKMPSVLVFSSLGFATIEKRSDRCRYCKCRITRRH